MSIRNIIQTTFDEFGKTSGGVKKSGSWYWRSDETVLVVNLQKSQYGLSYYINVALWLLEIGPADAPKPSHCQLQTRLARLVPQSLEQRLTELLDLEVPIDDETRHAQLLALLREYLDPVMTATATLAALRSSEGRQFVQASLVNAAGLRLLASGN
jgi:hypothetical protein